MKFSYDSENRLVSYGVTEAADTARLEYDEDGNLIKESSCTKEAVYAYNAANRMAESHITEIRDGSRQTPKDTVYAYDSFGRRILEGDVLNRWIRHTEYRGLSMDVWKNAAVHGIKEPRDSRGIDSTGMVFRGMQDFLPAFADFSRASPYDFTHVALTLPLGMGGEVFGLLQTEHSGIGFNPFVNASHTDAERHYFGKDHLGSVRAVTNQWGSPLYTFDYDVFGTPLQDRPERFRHGFTGKEFDSWTGLYNYGFRDYVPLYGRFTTVDPIQDGHNWYAYAVSDPVSWLDPWGLDTCPYANSGEDSIATNVTPAHWRDNGDGTWTAVSEGATLWEVWGADWKEKSGFTRDPRTLQVGETVGKKKDFTADSISPLDISVSSSVSMGTISTSPTTDKNLEKKSFFSDHSTSVAYRSEDGATAFYAGVGANFDIANGNFNLNAKTGVASYENSWKVVNGEKFKLGVTGRASGVAADAMIGLEGSLLGASADAHIFKGGGTIDITLLGVTVSIGGDVMVGGIGGSFLLGKKGFKASLDRGVGAGVQVTWKKENE